MVLRFAVRQVNQKPCAKLEPQLLANKWLPCLHLPNVSCPDISRDWIGGLPEGQRTYNQLCQRMRATRAKPPEVRIQKCFCSTSWTLLGQLHETCKFASSLQNISGHSARWSWKSAGAWIGMLSTDSSDMEPCLQGSTTFADRFMPSARAFWMLNWQGCLYGKLTHSLDILNAVTGTASWW